MCSAPRCRKPRERSLTGVVRWVASSARSALGDVAVSPPPMIRSNPFPLRSAGRPWEACRHDRAPGVTNIRPHLAVPRGGGRLRLGNGDRTVTESGVRDAALAGCRTDCGRKPVVDTPTPSQRVRPLQVSAAHLHAGVPGDQGGEEHQVLRRHRDAGGVDAEKGSSRTHPLG